jgi:DNA polymerase III delta prime subunit
MGQNLELTNSKVNDIALKLLKDFDIPNSYLYTLEDSPDAIKIKELKEFIEFSHSKPPYTFQIFFIQNISRFTLTSSNSLLKFLEEPGKQNIIFLTNT